jgi:hypothetical protein
MLNILKKLATITYITGQDNFYYLIISLIFTLSILELFQTKNIMKVSNKDLTQFGIMIVKEIINILL